MGRHGRAISRDYDRRATRVDVSFIETGEFAGWVREYLSVEAFPEFQRDQLNDPDTGVVMAGCGGLRKMRVPDPKRGKGKRGGGGLTKTQP